MAAQVSKRYLLGDYLLDPDKRLLSHGDTQIHLAHRPFQVLLYLLEHRDRIVTRRELLDQFWEGHDVYEVALSKCVGAIRKALDDQVESIGMVARELGRSVPVIQTVFSPLTVAGYLVGKSKSRVVRELRKHPEVVRPALDRID